MEDKKPSKNILDEIFDKAESTPNPQRPRFEYPPEDELPAPSPVENSSSLSPLSSGSGAKNGLFPASPPGGPGAKSGPPGNGSKLLPYVCLVMGAALLVAAVCLFQMVGMNRQLDELEEMVTNLDSVNQRLEEENDYLTRQNELLNGRVIQVKEDSARLEKELNSSHRSWNDLVIRGRLENMLNALEQFISAGDWLMSSALIEYYDFNFNEHSIGFIPGSLLPSQAARYLELREEVFDKAGCMVMESYTTTEDWSEYTERPYIGDNIFADEDLEAAWALLGVLQYYPSAPANAARQLAEFFQPGSEHIKRLTGGAFQPSTVELFEQIKADLIAQDLLRENEDGTVNIVIRYGEHSDMAAIPMGNVSRETHR